MFILYIKAMNLRLRIGNTSNMGVYIGGVKWPEWVSAMARASILVTEQIIYGMTGYDEMMGFPADQLTSEYLFPWYNNKAMASTVIMGVP